MSDIVERLRAMARCKHDDLSVADEAAAEITRLRVEVEALEASEQKWVDVAIKWEGRARALADAVDPSGALGLGERGG